MFDFTDDRHFLQTVAQLATTHLAPKVQPIDQGYYPLDEMHKLAQSGLYGAHLQEHGSRFDLAILGNAQVGKICGTTAFLNWCHQVMGLYIDQSDNAHLKNTWLHTHQHAQSFGGTALSNPMKTWANIESMKLTATPCDGGYTVSGVLPWISHIRAGQYCGAAARVQGSQDDVFFFLHFDEARKGSWQLHACPTFSGMEGSSTLRIELQDYFVGTNDIIANPCQQFIQKIRGAFVLMQMGIGAGIILGAIDDIKDGTAKSNAYLEDQVGNLTLELDTLVNKTITLAKTPFCTDVDFFLDVLDVRQEGALLALRATQAAMLHQGAKGYLMSAAPQRRLREAQFVAIVTPAIKHLRYLSQQLMREPDIKTLEAEFYI